MQFFSLTTRDLMNDLFDQSRIYAPGLQSTNAHVGIKIVRFAFFLETEYFATCAWTLGSEISLSTYQALIKLHHTVENSPYSLLSVRSHLLQLPQGEADCGGGGKIMLPVFS